jgi:hypothetical protein
MMAVKRTYDAVLCNVTQNGTWASPDPANLHMRGSIALEQVLINPKAPVCIHWMQQWPVLNESTSVYIDLWPNLGTSFSNSNVYFKASALLKGKQKFHLPSADSKQAVTPNILECNLKPDKGIEPK